MLCPMLLLSWRTLVAASLLACSSRSGHARRMHASMELRRGDGQSRDAVYSRLNGLSSLLTAMNTPGGLRAMRGHRSDDTENERPMADGGNNRFVIPSRRLRPRQNPQGAASDDVSSLVRSRWSILHTVAATVRDWTRRRNPIAAIARSKRVSAAAGVVGNWTRSHSPLAAIVDVMRNFTASHPKVATTVALALLFDRLRTHPHRNRKKRNQRDSDPDIDELLSRITRTRKGFYEQIFQEVEPQQSRPGENSTFCVQQVQGKGDCLFHSIAIGIAFEDDHCHLDMDDPVLTQRVRDLRLLAVDTLVADSNRNLYLEGGESISSGELVSAAAEQYNMTPEQYCNWMRIDGVWGGGPEILALVNALERPIHVFEPVPVNNGEKLELQLCGAFGSPRFDSRRRICICAADDKFPECKPVEVKRHGEGGGHFLSLLPTQGHCLPELNTDKN